MNKTSKPTCGVGWAFLFAMRRESKPFTRRLRFLQPFPGGPCRAALYDTDRGTAIVMETGVGMESAAAGIRSSTARGILEASSVPPLSAFSRPIPAHSTPACT